MSNCKYETKNGRCGLKGSYAYRHKCYTEDMCRCHEPKTNADHIRSMTDEELAEFLDSVYCHGWSKGANDILDADPYYHDWLKKPYEEVT